MEKKKLIYYRKDGRWEARFKKGVSASGKTLYGAVYGDTQEEAEQKRAAILYDQDRIVTGRMEMNLLILGAGTHGRDIYEIAKSLHVFKKIKYLDDQATGEDIIGTCAEVYRFRGEYPCAFVAIGDNRIRKKYVRILKEYHFLMPNMVSPTASVSPNVTLGEGVAILAQARVGEAQIGDYSIIASNSLVNSGAGVDAYAHVDSGSIVMKGKCVPEGMWVKSGEIYS